MGDPTWSKFRISFLVKRRKLRFWTHKLIRVFLDQFPLPLPENSRRIDRREEQEEEERSTMLALPVSNASLGGIPRRRWLPPAAGRLMAVLAVGETNGICFFSNNFTLIILTFGLFYL